jgi:molecular chaperone GrpE
MSKPKSTTVTDRESPHLGREEEPAIERPDDPAAGEARASDLDVTLERELEQLKEQLQEQQRIAAEAQDNFLRARADIDNYRRRARQEMDDVRRYGVEQIITSLLPVLDNFERALGAAQTSENSDALKEGISLIYRQLQEVLTKAGVEPIQAAGQPFDPQLHEAIMQVEAPAGTAPNTVVEELRTGYRLGDRVIRASLVKVAR